MMKKLLVLLAGILLIGINAFAADGDFIIEGKVGIGTDTPTAKLDVQSTVSNPTNNLLLGFTTSATSQYSNALSVLMEFTGGGSTVGFDEIRNNC